MAKVKALFSRQEPFYLMPLDTSPDKTFDAALVEVDEEALMFSMTMRQVIKEMEALFDDAPSYEEGAQSEAEMWAELIMTELGYE